MMPYKKWDVLVTAFPFVDEARSKRRPVLCVAAPQPTKGVQLYWTLMVTSTHLKGWAGDVEISDLKKAGMPIPSIIRTSKIACVDATQIEKRVGMLDAKTQKKVMHALKNILTDQETNKKTPGHDNR